MNLEKLWADVAPLIATYGVRVLGALLGLFVAFRVASALQDRVTGGLQKRKFDATLSIFFGNLARWLVVTASVLAILSIFGIETTSFAAIIGAAGLAVGLGFQGTLSNFSAGVMLLVFRPFKVEDVVVLSGQLGVVKEIGLFVTALDTLDGRRVILGNHSVANAMIENGTHNGLRRADVLVPLHSSVTADRAHALLNEAAMKTGLRDSKAGHDVVMNRFVPGGSEWYVRVWGPSTKYLDVLADLTEQTKRVLERENVGGPVPAMFINHQPG